MNELEVTRLKHIRHYLDRTYIHIHDDDEFKVRETDLLHAIAEYLIRPLQEHEYAERTKLPKKKKTAPLSE